MVEREVFLTKPKLQYHLSQWGEWVYVAHSWKERRLLRESKIIPLDKWTLILKNGTKWSFSYETKASNSFIPTRIMKLRCPIIKRMEIIMRIHVYPSWKANINSKFGRKRSFSFKTKASISFIPMRRMRLLCPVMKRKKIYANPYLSQLIDELWFWERCEVKFFLWNQGINLFTQ